MKNKQKGSALLIISIAIIIIIVIAAGVFYLLHKHSADVKASEQAASAQKAVASTTAVHVASILTPAPCGIHFLAVGTSLTADECYIQSTSGGVAISGGVPPTSYTIQIVDTTTADYKYASIYFPLDPKTGGTYTFTPGDRKPGYLLPFDGQINNSASPKLIAGKVIATPTGTDTYNVTFSVTFEGDISIMGAGPLSIKRVLVP